MCFFAYCEKSVVQMLAHGFVMIIDVLWQPRWSQPSEFYVPNFGTPHLTADLLQQKKRNLLAHWSTYPIPGLPDIKMPKFCTIDSIFNNGNVGDTTE